MTNEEPPKNRPRRHDYEKVLTSLHKHWKRRSPDKTHRINDIIDNLWETFGGKSCSWLGFYVPTPDHNGFVQGPHRGETPDSAGIDRETLHRAVETRESQLATHHAAILVPILDDRNVVLAVFAAKSPSAHSFNEEDRRWLELIVRDLGKETRSDQ